jgi:Tol biopolymer transport system component
VLLAGVTSSLLAAGAAGADSGPGWIAFTTTATPGRVVVVRADGSAVQTVSPQQFYASDPAWSPDGSRLAYALNPGSGAAEIFTAAPDGGDLRQVTHDAVSTGAVSGIANVQPSFSPDGGRLAFLKVVRTTAASGSITSEFDVWTIAVDGTDARRITADGGDKRGVAWQPHGSLLAYNRRDADGSYGLYVVPARGGPPARVAQTAVASFPVAWSPDGTRLAFLDAAGHPAVVKPDGSGLRELTRRLTDAPAWSPDGARVVYGGYRVFPDLTTRYGPYATSDVFSFDLATGDERRLTGDVDDTSVRDSQNDVPFFWPDGSRIFFRTLRGGGPLWMMNPDGTCEQPWAPQIQAGLAGPVWQPGARPGLGGLSCADLRVHVSLDRPQVALRSPATATVVVENDGNLAAADVRLTVGGDHGTIATGDSRCVASVPPTGLDCSLGSLQPQTTTTLDLQLSAPTTGFLSAHVEASTATPDPTAGDHEALVATSVLPCTLAGTTGADTLWGTPGHDHICGLPGPDHLYGRAGADYLDAGSGDDVIYGGPGRDLIRGGGGRDVIFARDGQRDTIDCGTEPDTAVVDRIDRVTGCERVLR